MGIVSYHRTSTNTGDTYQRGGRDRYRDSPQRESVAGFDAVGRPRREFDDRLPVATGKSRPGVEALAASHLAVDQPDRVDRKRNEQHVQTAGDGSVEPKNEGVVVGDRPSKHQPAGACEKRVGDLDLGGEGGVGGGTDETHGRDSATDAMGLVATSERFSLDTPKGGRFREMEHTPNDTPVGVDDPYAHAGVCDHLTDDGRCRYAIEHAEQDPEFARERRHEEFRCPVVDPDSNWDWGDCPHFRSRATDRECARCGLGERRMAHTDERPLLEEHHLSYASDTESDHEITVYLCRWCHAKIHESWARIDDDASPDPEAMAAKEGRRSRELDELGFESAADRYDS